MAKESLKDSSETYRSAYSTSYRIGLSIRRNLHIYLWTIAALALVSPQYPLVWMAMAAFFAIIGGNRNMRDEDGFGRGRGPYLKPVSNPKKRYITEEWHVIDAPPDKGGDGDWAFGNNRFTMEEVYANDDKARRHILIFGTTGSGKTVSLMGFMYQSIVSGSGLIFVDGKSDPKTWFELYAAAAAAGRTEDLLVLNFVVGAANGLEFAFDTEEEREEWEEFRAVESNTYNLFGTGTADTLYELGASLIGDSGGGDNKMWADRAMSLLRTLMKALCALRDLGFIQTSVQALRDHMVLEKLAELEEDDRISDAARDQIRGYLDELPGFRDAAKATDPAQRIQLMEQPNKQHGFLTMQFTGLFSELTGTYAHICDVTYSDINFPDVVYNRRILMVMLPALEKSPSSLANLGKMAVAGIKSALAQAISGRLSGSKRDIVDRRPTNAPRALLCILDEYGSYAVEGFGDVVAQARSLGVSAIFAGQEYAGFKKAGDNEAQRILSNTGIKIFLKNEDWETADIASKRLGEIEVLKTTGKQTTQGGREINSDPSYQSVARLQVADLAHLSEGQGILIYNNNLIPIAMPYVALKATKSAQRMDLVPLPGSIPPDRIKAREDRRELFKELESMGRPVDIFEFLGKARRKSSDPKEKEGLALALAMMDELIENEIVQLKVDWANRLHIKPFTGHTIPGIDKAAMPDRDAEKEENRQPLLDAEDVETQPAQDEDKDEQDEGDQKSSSETAGEQEDESSATETETQNKDSQKAFDQDDQEAVSSKPENKPSLIDEAFLNSGSETMESEKDQDKHESVLGDDPIKDDLFDQTNQLDEKPYGQRIAHEDAENKARELMEIGGQDMDDIELPGLDSDSTDSEPKEVPLTQAEHQLLHPVSNLNEQMEKELTGRIDPQDLKKGRTPNADFIDQQDKPDFYEDELGQPVDRANRLLDQIAQVQERQRQMESESDGVADRTNPISSQVKDMKLNLGSKAAAKPGRKRRARGFMSGLVKEGDTPSVNTDQPGSSTTDATAGIQNTAPNSTITDAVENSAQEQRPTDKEASHPSNLEGQKDAGQAHTEAAAEMPSRPPSEPVKPMVEDKADDDEEDDSNADDILDLW